MERLGTLIPPISRGEPIVFDVSGWFGGRVDRTLEFGPIPPGMRIPPHIIEKQKRRKQEEEKDYRLPLYDEGQKEMPYWPPGPHPEIERPSEGPPSGYCYRPN